MAAHPGASATDLGSEGRSLSNRLAAPAFPLAMPATIGARPMLRALTDPTVLGGQHYGPSFMFRGNTPVLERPSRAARDAARAARLWTTSVELSGLEPAFSKA